MFSEVPDVPDHVWVKCSSHRARAALTRIMGVTSPASYGRWPEGQWPSGEYYQVPVEFTGLIDQTKGLTVMKRKPADLFRRVNMR